MKKVLRQQIRLFAYHSLKLLSNFYYQKSSDIKIPIIVYHRVCPLYFKKNTVYANVYPEEFDKQMKYISENFEPITMYEFINRRKNNNLTGKEICITFDDGFKDNYLFAFPILKKYNLKATIFIVTKYIGSDKTFPWLKFDNGAINDLKINFNRWLPLSWNEIEEMMQYGIELGPHSHTHRTSLSKMTYNEAKDEIFNSTKIISDKLGYQPYVFCFPHGTTKDYNNQHINFLKLLGYKAAVTTMQGRNDMDVNPFELKRLIIYEEDTLNEFKKKVHGQYDFIGSLQKLWLNIFGTGN